MALVSKKKVTICEMRLRFLLTLFYLIVLFDVSLTYFAVVNSSECWKADSKTNCWEKSRSSSEKLSYNLNVLL